VLLYPQHVIEILNRLPGSAFAQIVQAGHDHQAFPAFVEHKADIAEICVCYVL
jgi:hypothetical protein